MKIINAHDKRKRTNDWLGIIIHHTGVNGRKEISKKLWARLYKNITKYLAKKDNNYVSAHFTISRQGEVTQLVDPDFFVAYHAGKSSYFHPDFGRKVSGWNRYAIGIELIGDGNLHSYSLAQYQALSILVKELMLKHKTIKKEYILGHEDISPGRKVDPGWHFNWQMFREITFGQV